MRRYTAPTGATVTEQDNGSSITITISGTPEQNKAEVLRQMELYPQAGYGTNFYDMGDTIVGSRYASCD